MDIIVKVVRHGETQENREGIIQGQLDTKLNDKGIEQSRVVAEALRTTTFDLAFSSDLSRAHETANIILEHHPLVELKLDQRLRERFLGEMQGHKGTYRSYQGPLPSSVESFSAVADRALEWWDATISPLVQSTDRASDAPIHILVVSHGALIATLASVLVRQRDFQKSHERIAVCFNTSVTTLRVTKEGNGTLVRYGAIDHIIAPVCRTNVDDAESAKHEVSE